MNNLNLTKNEEDALMELKNILSKKYRLIQLKLFGSKVKGYFDKESDIDVLIVIGKCNWDIEKDIYEICFEIGLKYDILLSPMVYSQDEIESEVIQATPFYKNVEKEGLPIWKKK